MMKAAGVLAGAALALLAMTAAAQPASQPPPAATQPTQPEPVQGDFVIRDFHFASGESLPALKLHYYTFGTPHRDAAGHVDNAVLIMHGTGGTGHSLIRPEFTGELIGPGQLLDASRYYLIFPDDIGHGQSSKPSDGLRARFPHYGYVDMVEAEHRLVTEGLHVDHLRLVMGTSMGCMHAFMWGETWPGMMDALMPLACNAVQIAGRNRLFRDMIIDAITSDPDWKNGDYTTEPTRALRTAEDITIIAGSAPQQIQKALPTRDAADAYLARALAAYLPKADANDTLYQTDSSRDYDPSTKLGDITAYVMWVNSADDFINPPELGLAEQAVKQIRRGRFVLLPIGPNTHGHGTHTFAVAWKQYLAQLLAESAGRSAR
ncbi:MAG TPA: alpha/beta fold hydrolase [Caulobacteraceae bacterium]|nr:alpha/beta fold hydrolase [Caulobacteraceae bacterium]